MAEETSNFNLSYFTGLDSYTPDLEASRWITVDTNLGAIVDLLGDGVIEGWDVSGEDGALVVTVGTGSGFIGGLASETLEEVEVALTATDGDYKIIANNTDTTYYEKDVTFAVIGALTPTPARAIDLGTFTIVDGTLAADTIDNSVKTMIGVSNTLLAALAAHVHSGTGSNPSKIDLSSQVQGRLSAENIGNIPASKFVGGIPAERIGDISHYDLLDIGVNTHQQLDDFVRTITTTKFQPLGLLNAINVMQAIITQGHWLGAEAFRYIANVRPVIVGIVPETYYEVPDPALTDRAVIDVPNYRVLGTHGIALDPPVDYVTSIDQVSGDYGFAGPRRVGWENLDLTGTVTPSLKLHKLYSYEYYPTLGAFFVTVDGGMSTEWTQVDWTKGLYGASGTMGSDGLELKVYAQSATRTEYLSTDYSTISEWKFVGDSSVNTGVLSEVDHNQYLRLMFLFNSNTLPTLIAGRTSPILTSLKISYAMGADSRCLFIPLYTHDEWISNSFSITNLDVSTAGAVSLTTEAYHYAGGILESPVIGSPKVVNWGELYTAFVLPEHTSADVYYRGSDLEFEPSDTTIEWIRLGPIAERVPMEAVDDKYIQLKVSFLRTGEGSGTPEVLSLGISVFEEDYTPSIAVSNYESSNYRVTLGASEAHNIPADSFVQVSGSVSALNGVFRVLPGSYGNTLAYRKVTNPITFTSPASGVTLGPCISRMRTWNKSGTGYGCWEDASSSVGVPGDILNLDDVSINGALTNKSSNNNHGIYYSPSFKCTDSDFLQWESIEVDGENLSRLTVWAEYSDFPNNDSWQTVGPFTPVTGANSPYILDISTGPNVTKKWVRVKLRFNPA